MIKIERIVSVLLEDEGNEEAEAFMRDVGFDATRGGKVYVLKDMDIIEKEFDELKSAVIRRTSQIMPELVKRRIVREDQAHVVAKMVTFYLAEQHYNPKRWHEIWQRAARKIFNYINGNMGWAGSLSRLSSD